MDVAVRPRGQSWSFPHDETGSRELISRMTALYLTMVVLEASGGLELPLVSALATASLPIVVVNPRQEPGFLPGPREHWPRPAVRPPVRSLRDSETRSLNSLVTRRRQLVAMLVSEKNRLGSAARALRPRIQAHIAWLEQQLDDLDGGLRRTLP